MACSIVSEWLGLALLAPRTACPMHRLLPAPLLPAPLLQCVAAQERLLPDGFTVPFSRLSAHRWAAVCLATFGAGIVQGRICLLEIVHTCWMRHRVPHAHSAMGSRQDRRRHSTAAALPPCLLPCRHQLPALENGGWQRPSCAAYAHAQHLLLAPLLPLTTGASCLH